TVAIAAAGGVALAAIQVLPFVEYLSRSSIVTTRILQGYQSTRWSTVQVFPLFAGSPAAHYSGPYGIADPFHEIVVFYVGIFALWLAAVALATSRRTHRRAPWIFAACGAVLIAYAYNVGGIGKLTGHLPFLASVMPNRSAAAWSLCIAVLVGFGVDALARLDAPARRNARWQLLAVTGMLTAAAAVLGYRGWHLVSFSNAGKSTQRGIAMSTLTHHVVFIMVTFAVGCVCAYLHAGSTNGHSKRLGGWGVVVVLFLQGGFLFRHHNPTVPSDRFMAVPAVTKSIASRIGANQTLWADAATLTPSVNLWIPTYSPDNYDVIGIASYERLYRAVLDPPAKFIVGGAQVSMLTGPYSPARDDSLRTLGIRRIVTNLDYPNEFGIASLAPAPVDMDNGQTLDYDAPYFHPTNLVLHTQGLPDESRIEITSGGDRPWTREATVYGGLATIELPDKIPARGSLTATVAGRGPAWSGRVVSGTFIDSNMPGLRLVDSIGQFHIFAVPGPSGFVFSPAATLHAANTDDAFEAAIDPHRSPPDSVVLEGPGTTTRGKPGTVTVRAQDPTRVAATVTRTSPGYVVFNQNDLPGWRATVDGRAARIVRANSTFMAVAVPEGTSQVTFRYQPRTVRIGMLISLAAIVAGIATLVVAAVLDRRRSRSAP
ncbi:MAG: YfhO family protein, partial [Actinobacteria bacterium]|nr:YfhO family protein [Actinomycetota bacterium]